MDNSENERASNTGFDRIRNSKSNSTPSESYELESNSSPSTRASDISISIGSSLPLVIFFGPAQVGKTVCMMRLLDYLKKHQNCQYKITKARQDERAENAEEAFNKTMNTISSRPPRTDIHNFLLLSVTRSGAPIFNILEAPGEHFFDSNNMQSLSFPNYLNQIFASDSKKIYVMFFEHDMFGNQSTREAYDQKIASFIKGRINPKRDRVIILYNKVDTLDHLMHEGRVNSKTIQKEIFEQNYYPQFLSKIKGSKNMKRVLFVPFHSGYFQGEDSSAWALSENFYPDQLWTAINYQLKKRWSLFG